MRHRMLAVVLLTLSAPVYSSSHETTLLKNNGCLGCHSLDGSPGSAAIGPAYPKVAQRYKNDPQALTKLVSKVRNGGYGNWGQMPMPPHPNVPLNDLRAMINFILKQ